MEEDIKEIMKKLGTAINESLQESARIQKLLHEMEEKGYSLTLSLAVIVGLNKIQQKSFPHFSMEGGKPLTADPTDFDRKFLKSLRIKLTEEKK